MSCSSSFCQHSASISALTSDLGRLEGKLESLAVENRELRKAVVKLAERLLQADLLADDDHDWLAALLGAHAQGKGERLDRAAARAVHRVVGKVSCRCGAVVDDIEGIVDERCPWCGAQLETQR
jgi:hypothetical protein